MKTMTATLAHAKGEVSLELAWFVLWTGEDFEVTVYDPESPDVPVNDFIDRFHTDREDNIPARVETILRHELLKQCGDLINVEK